MKDKAKIVMIKLEAIMDAYQGLPTMDRTELDYVAATLNSRMEDKNPRIRLSHTMALECLGAVGMLMCWSDEARRAVRRVG